MVRLIFSCLLISVPHAFATTGAVTGGYHIDTGANATITAHSVSKKVTNNHVSGLTIYVPLNSSTEWSTFVAGPPSGVLVEDVVTCGGTTVGGYCWYYGAAGDSCDTVCSTHGGTNAATISYVGSSGTDAQCQSVLAAFGDNATFYQDSCSTGWGCYSLTSPARRIRCADPVTTQSASNGIIRRVCACNN